MCRHVCIGAKPDLMATSLRSILLILAVVSTVAVSPQSGELADGATYSVVKLISCDSQTAAGILLYDSCAGSPVLCVPRHLIERESTGQWVDYLMVVAQMYVPERRQVVVETALVDLTDSRSIVVSANPDVDIAVVPVSIGALPVRLKRKYVGPPALAYFPTSQIASTSVLESLDVENASTVLMCGLSEDIGEDGYFLLWREGLLSHFELGYEHAVRISDWVHRGRNRILTLDYMLLDISAYSGNSGSPVFWRRRDSEQVYLIGVVVMSDTSRHLGYAIPSTYVLNLLEQARANQVSARKIGDKSSNK